VDPAARSRLGELLGIGVTAAHSLGGQHGVRHYRLSLADGRSAFAKRGNGLDGAAAMGRAAAEPASARADTAGFAAEAAGLRWLAEADATGVPLVLGYDGESLVLEWIEAEEPSEGGAAGFGRELARLHAAGAAGFGAPWPGVIAGLPLANDACCAGGWADWYTTHRVLPYARIGRDAGTLSSADVTVIESACARAADVAGPAEPPARLHGDCWSGNVLWSRGRGWLIDPAAHGGHRETDLAMLLLFGAPYLEQILAAYQEFAPLADGWHSRVPLHQLHPLLVHVCLFGDAYRDAALTAARAVLAS
jgi:fructosamine-3-kinase